MRKKILILAMFGICCLTGCSSHNNQSISTENITISIEDETSEDTYEEYSYDENNTEDMQQADLGNTEQALSINDFDYIGQSGCCFQCSETLDTISDNETSAEYKWIRDDGTLHITTELSSYSFDEWVESVKELYADGTILQDDLSQTINGKHESYIRIIQQDEDCTAIGVINLDNCTIVMTCDFNSEDGLHAAEEALQSFSFYVPE